MNFRKISESCEILDKRRVYSENGGVCASACGGAADVASNGVSGKMSDEESFEEMREGSDEVKTGDVVVLKLAWPGDSYPGCFFQLQPRTEYLRRPISLCGSGDGYIELAIRVAGEGTRELVSRKVGEKIECFGPLGRGFEIPERPSRSAHSAHSADSTDCFEPSHISCEKTPRYLVIGGGIGVAPLLPLIRVLRQTEESAAPSHGSDVASASGAATDTDADTDTDAAAVRGAASSDEKAAEPFVDFVVGFRGRPYFESDATHICSEDAAFAADAYLGAGRCIRTHRGTVFSVVEDLLAEHPLGSDVAYDDIFICGPKKMLDALALLCLHHGYNPQLLTEAHMGCGVGACLVCTTEVRSEQKYARVCADGPMFRASELKFGDDGASEETQCVRIQTRSEREGDFGAKRADFADAADFAVAGDCEGGKEQGGDALSVNLGRLHLKSLLTMASGTFGFGREYDAFFDIGILGAVSVKGLTLAQKAGNPGRRVVEIAGGMINSVGLQNPGVEHFIAHEAEFLRRKKVAVIANINGESVSDMVRMATLVDPHVDAIELNISCPNVSAGGMSFGTEPRMTAEIVRAVRRASKSPLIVKLTPNVTNIVEIAQTCEAEGAEILSMINTVTGLAVDWSTGVKPLARGFGGMSGPAVKPVALRCIDAVSSKVRIPILGMGGISSARDVIEFLRVGASAVAIGTAIFRDPLLPVKIDAELRELLRSQGKRTIRAFYHESVCDPFTSM